MNPVKSVLAQKVAKKIYGVAREDKVVLHVKHISYNHRSFKPKDLKIAFNSIKI